MEGGRIRVTRDELRSMTIDANDGIIATAGILEGFSGAGAGYTTLLIAATSALVAGTVAIAGARYSESAGERDAQRALIAEEERQLSASPAEELAELTEHYRQKGLTEQLAADVAAQLTAENALAAHVEAEYGVNAAGLISPIRASVLTGLAYMIGSGVPFLAALLSAEATRIWVTFLAVVVSLVITSVVVARSDRIAPTAILRRTLTIGIVTMLLTLTAGTLINL
jgi:VIT1/CCC1 family predicted Fe2+/Mn2+ transporter